jgi:hypothetical protein
MRCKSARELTLVVVKDADFFLHFEFVVLCSCLDEWPVKVVSVEGCENCWLCLSNVFEEPF